MKQTLKANKRNLLEQLATGKITLEQFKKQAESGVFIAQEQEDGTFQVKWQRKATEILTAQEVKKLESIGGGIIGGFIFFLPE